MADVLTCEIIQEMASISIGRCTKLGVPESELDLVYGLVDGDYQMELLFRAEPRFFYRMAENMIGDPPEDELEVQEYASEFFNTLCGRFISEIYRATRRPARFHPIRYQTASECQGICEDGMFVSLYFVSDQKEYVEFSWTKCPMEELLKRSEEE